MAVTASMLRCLALTVLVALTSAGCASGGDIKDSDPHLVGERDMNYDHLIVPGVRIGPVGEASPVSAMVQHLGEPTYVGRFDETHEVMYTYVDECIAYEWKDTGIEPKVELGRGVFATCDKWATAEGVHVGMPVKDAVSKLGPYCTITNSDGTLEIDSTRGIELYAPGRNGQVSQIVVVPTGWTPRNTCISE